MKGTRYRVSLHHPEGQTLPLHPGYSCDADLNAFLATHVLHWRGVRFDLHHAVYVGKTIGGKVDTPMPDFRRDAKHSLHLLKAISRWLSTPLHLEVCGQEGRREMWVTIVAGEVYEAYGDDVEQAVMRAAWLALEDGIELSWGKTLG